MTRQQRILAIVSTAAVAAGLGYTIGARAGGIPATGALSYAGVIQNGSGPLTGSHSIEVSFLSAASGGSTLCSTSTSVTVTNGYFSVPLPDTCTTAVGGNPNVWVDVVVDGSDTGTTKIGAVPYSVEANHAVGADNATDAGTLGTTLSSLQSSVSVLQGSTSTDGTSISSLQSSVSTLQANVTTLQGDESSHASSIATLQSDVSTLQSEVGGLPLLVETKGGNNGTDSCDTYCATTKGGATGTCVGAYDTVTLAYVACATVTEDVTRCWCSRPTYP